MSKRYYFLRFGFFITRIVHRYFFNSKVSKIVCNIFHKCVRHELFGKGTYELSTNNVNKIEKSDFVWFFWDTPLDKSPDIVKACFEQLKVQMKTQNVVLLSFGNLDQYLQLPEYILDKFNDGTISTTHLSDIIRMGLLSSKGGIWVDATVLLTGHSFTKELMDGFFTVKRRCNNNFNVSESRWTGFLIGGDKFGPVAGFAYNFFLEYWKKNSVLLTYFLIDYVLDEAYRKNVYNFKFLIDNLENSNKKIGSLIQDIRDKSVSQIIEEYDGTEVFKLTYKKKIDVQKINQFISLNN